MALFIWPVLVVCPSSLREQWADAISCWLKVPADGVVVGYKQADAERQIRVASRQDLQFAVVSYELVTRVQKLLLAVGEEGAAAMGPGWTPRVELRAPELFDETHEAVAPALPGGAP